jgi:hypothetical protein
MRQLIEDLISMMEYHVEQTRPIHSTTVALQAAREALKAMPAPVQEPHKELSEHMMQATNGRVRIDPVTGNAGIGTPPAAQRQWVGLSDEETLSIFATCHEGRAYPQDFYSGPRAMRLTEGRAIEAKLKEKNT